MRQDLVNSMVTTQSDTELLHCTTSRKRLCIRDGDLLFIDRLCAFLWILLPQKRRCYLCCKNDGQLHYKFNAKQATEASPFTSNVHCPRLSNEIIAEVSVNSKIKSLFENGSNAVHDQKIPIKWVYVERDRAKHPTIWTTKIQNVWTKAQILHAFSECHL